MPYPSHVTQLSSAGLRLFLCSLFFSCLAAVAQTPALSLTLGTSEAIASGATPGGRVVFFAVTQEISEDEVATLRRRDGVQIDADGDGAVSFDLGGPVAPRSIWLAVDLATGAYAQATPGGDPPKQGAFEGPGLVLGAPLGTSDSISDLRTFLEVLVVRPGVAAWARTLADGGASDSDGKVDGSVEARLDALTQMVDPTGAESPAPSRFVAQDLIFSFDPMALEIVTVGANTVVGGVQ